MKNMLLTIKNAQMSLSNSVLIFGGCNAVAVALFVIPLFRELPTHHLLLLMAVMACIGAIVGAYLKYRSDNGTASALFFVSYFVVTVEFFIGGGGAASAAWIAGRTDLGWLVFCCNCFLAATFLLGGVYREARRLQYRNPEKPGYWKAELGKYIDYSTCQVDPVLTQSTAYQKESFWKASPFWIVAIGTTNIPLAFELYGGGRNNSVFLAVPMAMLGIAWINLGQFGPGMMRLFLLRKLEAETGRRFINADYEQIQELRRTFFLSRWLMKGYAAKREVPSPSSVSNRQCDVNRAEGHAKRFGALAMLMSIENAPKALNQGWLYIGGFNVVATALFIAPLFRDLPKSSFFAWLILAACSGLITGLYLKYRTDCGTALAFFGFFYFLIAMQIMTGGGGAALMAFIAARTDLCWVAFGVNTFCVVVSILGGMYRESIRLELWKEPSPWKEKLAQYVDYSTHRIIPRKTNNVQAEGNKWTKYGPLIIMAGPANFSLFFEYFGGGRNNGIFLVAPLLAGVFSYLNLKQLGPAFLRLLLVRGLENEAGRRFANADYEQIQELRRTFFLSRWLMKDYVHRPDSSSVSSLKTHPKKCR